jgi:hypothetical protein
MTKVFNSKAICLELLAAESEDAVQKIIDNTPAFRSGEWRPLDRRETNFNVTSNQASDGGKALTELMTNMVDAVLMKHALQKGINPKGREAPQTMYAAVDKLIRNLRGGRLVDADDANWLRDFAQKNLVIGITGAKTKKEGLPCYTFVDNGEGQHSDLFEDTFLSLSAGNKKDIPFVQGKYNMGSSGVLGYCGMRWFKLIISRRYDQTGEWGWTLMRRRPGAGMPIAEYFVYDGEVPSFQSDLIYPFITMTGKKYDGSILSSGTIVKLYDYQVGAKFHSFKGAREALNENLVETILPFRLLDFRQLPKTKEALEKAKRRGGDRAEGVDPRPFYGMEFLLLRSHREDGVDLETEDEPAGESKFTVGTINDPELGEIKISAIPLKRNPPGWLKTSNNRIFHSVNGQVQYKQTRGFLSTTCGFPALKDRVVIIVDASQLTFGAHNDVWKGDREHIRRTVVGEQYLAVITQSIKESQALADLQKRVAREELERAAQTERNDLFQKLVDADPNLANLLTSRDPQIRFPSSGGKSGGEVGEGTFEGKFSPTFLRIDEKQKTNGIEVPINKTRSVAARTDAENEFFVRADNVGRLVVDETSREKFSVRAQLHNGRLTVYLDPRENKLAVGDTATVQLSLIDDAMANPVTDQVTIRIVEEDTTTKPTKKRAAAANAGNKGQKAGEGDPAPTHGLPRYKLLTRDGRTIGDQDTEAWPDEFDEVEGGIIEDLGEDEGVLYKINWDNAYHLKYRLQQRGDLARDVVTEKFILGMRIAMLGFEHALKAQMKAGDQNGISEYADEFRKAASRGAAAVILALAENLPKIVDKSSVEAEAE